MKIRNIFILAVGVLLSACNDWLDVKPQGQVEGTDLLVDEKGYNAALNGVYYKLTANALYGKELSFGMMDVLAQYWDLSLKNKNGYYQQFLYNYEDVSAKNRIDAIWTNMYQAITQTNYILENLQGNKGQIRYAELIEGELYALRAFLHMELAAMFGPVIRTDADLDKPCIAYRTTFDVMAQKFESSRSVLTKAKEDLLTAERLLENDPILENMRDQDGNTSMLDFHSVLERRGARMNLFGVKGLLMRIDLALLDKSEAFRRADELIRLCKETGVFQFVDWNNTVLDANLGGEMLLAFYKNDLWSVTKEVFGFESGNSDNNFCVTTSQFQIFVDDLYGLAPDGSGGDYRLTKWFERLSQDNDWYVMPKFQTPTGNINMEQPYDPELPILRLPELYYVACEALIGEDNAKAVGYLNEVRASRNLEPLEETCTDEELMEYLMRDMRKEFLGEGRMFLTYKRLFREFYVKEGVIIAPSEDKFVFPVPELEYEYSPNEKPE